MLTSFADVQDAIFFPKVRSRFNLRALLPLLTALAIDVANEPHGSSAGKKFPRNGFRYAGHDFVLASGESSPYSERIVKRPLINVEEQVDRVVGKRMGTPNALSTATSNKADAIAWRKALGGVRVPRGVHRFKTHEEADRWMWKRIASPTR